MEHVPYVRYYTDYPSHRKTFALRRILGDVGEIYPPRLWAWCASNSPDGTFSDDVEIEQAAGWLGEAGKLVEALRKSGFMVGRSIHAWDDKSGAGVREIIRKRTASPSRNSRRSVADLSHKSKSKSKSNTESERESENVNVSCSEPENSPASDPGAMQFVTVGKETCWTLTEKAVREFEGAFPGLDILGECRKASAWLGANPTKRKTARGMGRFLFGWLERAQNRGPAGPAPQNLFHRADPPRPKLEVLGGE